MNNRFDIKGDVKNSVFGSSIQTKEFVQTKNIIGRKNEEEGTRKILKILIDKAIRIMERKHTKRSEDILNDDFTDYLRDNGYKVTDQTRSGRSSKNAGELDFMIRKENGTPISIIEAFRLKSCGEKNEIVSSHIDKLLHDYDTAGLKNNFVLIYAESSDFIDLWKKYFLYMANINSKMFRKGAYCLVSFEDTTNKYTNITDIKIGRAIHKREGNEINIFHIFINMYSQNN